MAHARCRSFAEGISFYGGEATEKVMLDQHFAPVLTTFKLLDVTLYLNILP